MRISNQWRVPLLLGDTIMQVQKGKVEISKNELIKILNDIDLTDGSRITNLKIPKDADIQIRNGVFVIEWEGE
jgi:hypothetical protein